MTHTGLPAGEQAVCGAHVTGGVLEGRTETQAGTLDWVVQPERFELTTFSAIPADRIVLNDAPLDLAAPASTGVGPVGLASDAVTFTHTVTLHRDGEPVDAHLVAEPVLQSVPAAAWSLAAAQATAGADMTALHGVAPVIAGAHPGIRLRPKVERPDVTCQVALDALLSEDAPTERDFTWSPAAPASTRYLQTDPFTQLAQDLAPGASATVVRGAILGALASDGIIAADLAADLVALRADAPDVLTAGPVLSSLGAPA